MPGGAEQSRETAAYMRSGYETRFNRRDVLVRHIGKRSTKRAGTGDWESQDTKSRYREAGTQRKDRRKQAQGQDQGDSPQEAALMMTTGWSRRRAARAKPEHSTRNVTWMGGSKDGGGFFNPHVS